jgi:hypothetical protein
MQLVNEKMDNIFARFDTTLEYMAITAMQEAGMKDGSGVVLADYGIAAAASKAISGGLNAITVLTAAARAIRKQVGNVPIHAICGGTALDIILASAEADALLSGPYGQQLMETGAIAKIGGVFLHEIDSSYATVGTPDTKVDSLGTSTMIVGPERGATQMVYGANEMLSGLVMAEKAVDTYVENDPVGQIVRCEMNPLPVVTRPKAFQVFTVS